MSVVGIGEQILRTPITILKHGQTYSFDGYLFVCLRKAGRKVDCQFCFKGGQESQLKQPNRARYDQTATRLELFYTHRCLIQILI